MNDKTNAAMLGMLAAAVTSWDSYDKDTQRRLRNLRDDAEDALQQIREFRSRGEQVRLRLPSVMDALLGIALANPTQTTPEILPSSTKLTRPQMDEGSASDLSWPPKTGTYDSQGRVSELGELTRTFLAHTFQEVRAFVEGMAQDKAPSQAGLLQINRAAKQLIYVLSTLNLTSDAYRHIWTTLFSSTPGSPSPSDPHLGVPQITNINAANNVASIVFAPNSTKNDREMRIRVTASGAGNIAAQTDLCTILFAQPWQDSSGNPLIPAVIGSKGLYASVTNANGVVLQVAQQIALNTTEDFSILVGGR